MKLYAIDAMVQDYQEEIYVGIVMESEFWVENIIQKKTKKTLDKV